MRRYNIYFISINNNSYYILDSIFADVSLPLVGMWIIGKPGRFAKRIILKIQTTSAFVRCGSKKDYSTICRCGVVLRRSEPQELQYEEACGTYHFSEIFLSKDLEQRQQFRIYIASKLDEIKRVHNGVSICMKHRGEILQSIWAAGLETFVGKLASRWTEENRYQSMRRLLNIF